MDFQDDAEHSLAHFPLTAKQFSTLFQESGAGKYQVLTATFNKARFSKCRDPVCEGLMWYVDKLYSLKVEKSVSISDKSSKGQSVGNAEQTALVFTHVR